jgi:hypothetical protein
MNKKIIEMVLDLGWEFERMSSSGQETYNKLCKILNIQQIDKL